MNTLDRTTTLPEITAAQLDRILQDLSKEQSLNREQAEQLRMELDKLVAELERRRADLSDHERRGVRSALTEVAAPALSVSAAAGLLAASALPSGGAIPALVALAALLGSAAVYTHRRPPSDEPSR